MKRPLLVTLTAVVVAMGGTALGDTAPRADSASPSGDTSLLTGQALAEALGLPTVGKGEGAPATQKRSRSTPAATSLWEADLELSRSLPWPAISQTERSTRLSAATGENLAPWAAPGSDHGI